MRFQFRYSIETESIAWCQLYISACVKMMIYNYNSIIHQLRDFAKLSSEAQTHRIGGIHYRIGRIPVFYYNEGESMIDQYHMK